MVEVVALSILAALAADAVSEPTPADLAKRAEDAYEAIQVAIERHKSAYPNLIDADSRGLVPQSWWERGTELERVRQEAWSIRWDARIAAGLDPRTGRTGNRRPATGDQPLPGSGYYPDLLEDTSEVRGFNGRDYETISNGNGIVHTACGTYLDRHHIRRLVDGVAVAGMTLRATRTRGGLQSATIDRVFTRENHRRHGYATEILDYARGYFRVVKHSRDLTGDGRRWKRAVK